MKNKKEIKKSSSLSHEEIFNNNTPWKWYNQTWWWIRHGIWNKIDDLRWQIPNAISRIKRGWGHADVWGFDYYLTNVIIGGLKRLKNIQHILPCWDGAEPEEVAQKRWDKIMDKMIGTFETAKDILEHDTMYIPIKEWSEKRYQENLNFAKRIKRKFPDYPYRVLSKKKCLAYEEGWKLFAKHFFNLWD